MNHARLRTDLERLHRELREVGEAGEMEPADRELLADVLRDIEGLLEREVEEGEESGLAERLREAMERFEAEHPQLTAAVGRIANALSNLGV